MANRTDSQDLDLRVIYRAITGGLIVSKDGKFLLGMKNPEGGGVYADCWHIPGGGIEEGESELQALQREMAEEVGINIDEAKVLLLDDRGRGQSEKILKDTGEKVLCKMTFKVYRIDLNQNASDIAITPGDDIEKTRWIDPADLPSYKLTPPSIELFKRLGYLGS